MFDGVLNKPLAGIGWKSYLFKKFLKIINFTLKTSGKNCYGIKRRIKNPVKHLRWRFFEEIVNGYMLLTIF